MIKMRRITLSILFFACWVVPCHAQQRAIERIHISLDRTLYIAGERIWLSLYCFDLSGSRRLFSEVSSVAYVELRNDASLVSGVKLRIERGRGSGNISIPPSLPTGNYRLIAYTKQMLNEETLVCFDKVIPIYNTLSSERLDGVMIAEESEAISQTHRNPLAVYSDSKYIEVEFGVGNKTLAKNASFPLRLKNLTHQGMTFSISVARSDLPETETSSLQDFFANPRPDPAKIDFRPNFIPEYEGEIINGRIKNIREIEANTGSVFLSAIGKSVSIYSGPLDLSTGEFTFFTNSLFGNGEIALEYLTPNEVSFELYDPFVKPPVPPVPPLYLDKRVESILSERNIEMQISHRFGIDTLYESLPVHEDPFFSNTKPVVYLLDNYTRFPTMPDIMLEFIPEMRHRRVDGHSSFQVLLSDWGWEWAFNDNSLTVIDGIPVFDHDIIKEYDPLKVKSLSIYQNRYRIGDNIFNGVAKFDTYLGNYPGLTLKKNALIMDYQGVQYPCRFTGYPLAASKNLPDVRTLLYWDPQIVLGNGEDREIEIRTSSIQGSYTVVLEGVAFDGSPIYFRSDFTVE